MSFPQNLPKPPPKAPPGPRGPVTAPPSAAPMPPRAPAVGAAPAPRGPHTPGPQAPGPAAAAKGTRAAPTVDTKSLPASLGPMVEAIRLYDDLLAEENAALKAGDSKSVEALLDRKMAATRLYQERLRTFLCDQQCTKTLSPEQRSNIVAMVRGLEVRAKENTMLLKANMKAIEQVFEVINTAARKIRKQETVYSKAGVVRDGYSQQGVSLAYNNTI